MEFDYELTKEDRKLFIKEFRKNKLVFQYYKADFLYWFNIVFNMAVFFGLLYLLESHYEYYFRRELFIWYIIGLVLGLLTLLKTTLPLGFSLYRWNTIGKMSLTYENINIYEKKNFFSFNSLQVKKVFETESFYSILAEHYTPWYTFLLIIPKKLLKSEDENNLMKEYIENYTNKLKIQKPKFMLYKYFHHITAIVIIVFVYLYITSLQSYNKELGMRIISVPMIIGSEKKSPHIETGMLYNIIAKVDGKFVLYKSPRQINNMIKNRKHDINIITMPSYGAKKYTIKK